MELKRIIARDSRSANEKAIQMYGQDVLIISSHKVDNQIELVVAVETAPVAPLPLADHAFKPLAVLDDAPPRTQQAPAAQAFTRVFEEQMVSPAEASEAGSTESSEHDMVMDALTALSRRVVSQPAAPVSLEPVTPAPVAASADMVHDFRRSQETVELLRQEMSALRQ